MKTMQAPATPPRCQIEGCLVCARMTRMLLAGRLDTYFGENIRLLWDQEHKRTPPRPVIRRQGAIFTAGGQRWTFHELVDRW